MKKNLEAFHILNNTVSITQILNNISLLPLSNQMFSGGFGGFGGFPGFGGGMRDEEESSQ